MAAGWASQSAPGLPHAGLCMLHLTLTLVGIILGTHHEKGAFTFWSYAIGLPLPSSSILSWKFCHVLHKVLRDGHPNVSSLCPLVPRGSPVAATVLLGAAGGWACLLVPRGGRAVSL